MVFPYNNGDFPWFFPWFTGGYVAPVSRKWCRTTTSPGQRPYHDLPSATAGLCGSREGAHRQGHGRAYRHIQTVYIYIQIIVYIYCIYIYTYTFIQFIFDFKRHLKRHVQAWYKDHVQDLQNLPESLELDLRRSSFRSAWLGPGDATLEAAKRGGFHRQKGQKWRFRNLMGFNFWVHGWINGLRFLTSNLIKERRVERKRGEQRKREKNRVGLSRRE